jgi:hypothetical protein
MAIASLRWGLKASAHDHRRAYDETVPRQSTFTISCNHRFKVKAKLYSKSFWFPPLRLLLGLYDYRFKHLAVMEGETCDVITNLQVDGLAQFFRLEESRTTPFQEDDEGHATGYSSYT